MAQQWFPGYFSRLHCMLWVQDCAGAQPESH